MKNLILLTAMLLSSVSVYATCVPPIGKCECAYPILENGSLKCGPTYCPTDTVCMPNGSCCAGEKFKNIEENYSCCQGATSFDPTHVVVSVFGAPVYGLQTCCDIATYGENPTAYWDGAKAVCCKGDAYQENGNWYCCDGTFVEAFNSSGVSVCCPNQDGYTGSVTAYTYEDGGDLAKCCYGEPYAHSFDGTKNTYACCGLNEMDFYEFERIYQDEKNPTPADYINNHDVCETKGWSKVQGCCMDDEIGIFTNSDGLNATCCPTGREYMDFEYEHLWGVSGYSSPTSYKIESSWKCCEEGKVFHSSYEGPAYDPKPNAEIQIVQTEMCCNVGEVAYRPSNSQWALKCCAGTPYYEQDGLYYYGTDLFPEDGFYHNKNWKCCETGKVIVPSSCRNADGMEYESYCCPEGSTAHGYNGGSSCTCY